jgi:hypothetical protein
MLSISYSNYKISQSTCTKGLSEKRPERLIIETSFINFKKVNKNLVQQAEHSSIYSLSVTTSLAVQKLQQPKMAIKTWVD